jgi:hypothetical protein
MLLSDLFQDHTLFNSRARPPLVSRRYDEPSQEGKREQNPTPVVRHPVVGVCAKPTFKHFFRGAPDVGE